MKMKYKILTICIFTILLTTYASAFGITAFYYEGRPLILNPGSTRDTQLILQNEKTSPPITIEAVITSGSNIAQITGRTVFDLPSGANNIPVNIKISIPEDAKIGDEYTVGFMFSSVAKPGKGKMLELGTQIGKAIPVVVSEVREKPEIVVVSEPKKPLKDIISLGSLGIIVLIIIILALFLKSKKKKSKKKKK